MPWGVRKRCCAAAKDGASKMTANAKAIRCLLKKAPMVCQCVIVRIAALPNGSRLSCGRLAGPAQGCGTIVRDRRGANTPFPLERPPPASFKRFHKVVLGSALLG